MQLQPIRWRLDYILCAFLVICRGTTGVNKLLPKISGNLSDGISGGLPAKEATDDRQKIFGGSFHSFALSTSNVGAAGEWVAGPRIIDMIINTKQEHQEQQLKLPTNDLIGRGEAKEFVLQWMRKPSNEYQTSSYCNISVLCVVGHGGMGKTLL
ncbi:hypothetical protein IEQ34_007846 [Dendrobium chrysotoxum]|uniref:Uncharacterized protein n=1 Tax=Dendrobium chrysotoxum TaxID=161865 RepID=A0AAV7H625_DENCH|nr:hypothetical protein IEQ34_007846 [Dendrobium chrysotoxum]